MVQAVKWMTDSFLCSSNTNSACTAERWQNYIISFKIQYINHFFIVKRKSEKKKRQFRCETPLVNIQKCIRHVLKQNEKTTKLKANICFPFFQDNLNSPYCLSISQKYTLLFVENEHFESVVFFFDFFAIANLFK